MNKLLNALIICAMTFTLCSCFINQGDANVITYDANGGIGTMPTQLIKIGEIQTLHFNQFSKKGYVFIGWSTTPNGDLEYEDGCSFTASSSHSSTLYAVWGNEYPLGSNGKSEVLVGEKGITYTIPTEYYDRRRTKVKGGYFMAKTETTYELWNEIRVWAEGKGYFFRNLGAQGDGGWYGYHSPTDGLPVTAVSWRDVIVWCNAYSEFNDLNPVYRTKSGDIIKDARDANASQVDSAIQTANNGYRLPTSDEWEMAARWRNTSGDGSILVEGRYWTPGIYISGAKSDYNSESEAKLFAWFYTNSDNIAHKVGIKKANDLGIYDMSGNVSEWCFDLGSGNYRLYRGGSFLDLTINLRIQEVDYLGAYHIRYSIGFRVVRTS